MKKANESLSAGLGGFIISGTETNPKSNVQKTLQMKFQIVIKKNLNYILFSNQKKKEILQKRIYHSITEKGFGREVKEKINENIIQRNSISPSPQRLASPSKIIRTDSMKKTMRITQQEFDRRVNEALIKYYEKFMVEVPNLINEIEAAQSQRDLKEIEYMEYLEKVRFRERN